MRLRPSRVTALVKHGSHVPSLRARERAKTRWTKTRWALEHVSPTHSLPSWSRARLLSRAEVPCCYYLGDWDRVSLLAFVRGSLVGPSFSSFQPAPACIYSSGTTLLCAKWRRGDCGVLERAASGAEDECALHLLFRARRLHADSRVPVYPEGESQPTLMVKRTLTTSQRCEAIVLKRNRCTNTASGGVYCWKPILHLESRRSPVRFQCSAFDGKR